MPEPTEEEKRTIAEQTFFALIEGMQKNNKLLEVNAEAINNLNEGVDMMLGLVSKYEEFLQIMCEKAVNKVISSSFLESVHTVIQDIKKIEESFLQKK